MEAGVRVTRNASTSVRCADKLTFGKKRECTKYCHRTARSTLVRFSGTSGPMIYNRIIPFTTARTFSRSSALRVPRGRPSRSSETERSW